MSEKNEINVVGPMVTVRGLNKSSVSIYIPHLSAVYNYRNTFSFHLHNGKFLDIVVATLDEVDHANILFEVLTREIAEWHIDVQRNSQ